MDEETRQSHNANEERTYDLGTLPGICSTTPRKANEKEDTASGEEKHANPVEFLSLLHSSFSNM
jgi:hypothetical protein